MPTAEIKILCNQIIEEVKLISTGVDDIATLGGGESKVIDRLKELGLGHLENAQNLVIDLTGPMTADQNTDGADEGSGEEGAGGEGQE